MGPNTTKPGHAGWVSPNAQRHDYNNRVNSGGLTSFSNAGPGGRLGGNVRTETLVNNNTRFPGRPRPIKPSGGQTTVAGSLGIGDAFTDALLGQINAKPLPDRNPEGNINNALSGLAANEAGAAAALQRNAAASGFGAGGGIQGGLQSLYEGFAGQKADTAQNIRNDMEALANQDRLAEEQRQLQALGIASGRLNQQEALDAQQAMHEAELANRLRISQLNNKPAAPTGPSNADLVNMMQLAGAGAGNMRPGGPTPQWGGANMLGGGLGGGTTTNPGKGVPFAPWIGSNAPAGGGIQAFKGGGVFMGK